MSKSMSGFEQLGVRLCARCGTMKRITGKNVICARCCQEFDEEFK